MQLLTGGKDMGEPKASFMKSKLNAKTKNRQNGTKDKVATKQPKSAKQKYKVQIKRQNAKLK